MKKKNCFKEASFWSGIIAFVCVLLFVGGIVFKLVDQVVDSYALEESTATVKKVVIPDTGNSNYIYIKFWAGNVLIDDIKKETTKSYTVGDEITVYYDAENPFDNDRISLSRNNSGNIFGIFFLSIPILVVGWAVIKSILEVRMHNYLADNGTIIRAEVIDTVRRVSRRRRNSSSHRTYVYYNMICEGSVNGMNYRFVKSHLTTNPEHMIGAVVDVYVDINDPRKYVVDYDENDQTTKMQTFNRINGEERYYDRPDAYTIQPSKQISTSTFANDFDDFMNELDNK